MSGLSSKFMSYDEWFLNVRETIENLQLELAVTANKYLITLYWELGERIHEAQSMAEWGDKVIEKLAKDLSVTFPEVTGFSRRNLYSIRRWYLFFKSDKENVFDLLCKVPWGHNITIVSKIKGRKEAIYYLVNTVEHGWSRSVLTMQIDTKLYKREGKAITNFHRTLPKSQSDLAIQTLKDPYIFNFLQLEKGARERDIEKQLTEKISDFLVALGKGFAFVGRQYKLTVSDRDFYLDLLFYHLELRCFVVIELKAVDFEPEFTGKLNFYLSAVDDQLKKEQDNPTIGILLCMQKDKLMAEYALRDVNKPIGISNFNWQDSLPDDLKPKLPTVEEFEEEFYEKKK